MNSNKNLQNLIVDQSQQKSASVTELKKHHLNLKKCTKAPALADYRQGKKTLYLASKKGEVFNQCASLDERYLCCHFHVIHSISNCPFDCSYCFLQNYLTNTTTTLITDTKAILAEIQSKVSQNSWYLYRIGNWELGDSLVFNPLTKQTNELIEGIKNFPNVLFELRTKSDCVDEILDLNHQQKTIVSWTVSPDCIIKQEEHGTASLKKRLQAMQKVIKAGYLIGLHFDPMLYFKGWETAYSRLVKAIFQAVSPQNISWISIGSLRFNPEMKKTIEANFPTTKITTPEMITGNDRKMRYVKPLRVKMYQHLYQEIRKQEIKFALKNPIWIYLCMERWDMWQKVFGFYPKSIQENDFLLVQSLAQRFPQLVSQPNWELYQQLKIE